MKPDMAQSSENGFMEPVVAVLLRRFDIQLRQLDSDIELKSDPLRRTYRIGDRNLAVLSLYRDLFRLRTGSNPCWEARIKNPEEALDGLSRVFDYYWQLMAQERRETC
ncbi:MAG: hypothetical protein GY835_17685 [bacterium]|nr:hypothetical protein [bacterium]